MLYMTILFSVLANHQTRYQGTRKVGCQSGVCRLPLNSSSDVCVGIYGLTYSLDVIPSGVFVVVSTCHVDSDMRGAIPQVVFHHVYHDVSMLFCVFMYVKC